MMDTRGRRGLLVAVEGIDGSGKSTLVRSLARALRQRGYSVATRREPADRALGALAQRAGAKDAWTGAVYFTLDRFAARPGLERDLARYEIVLSDRSMYSTLAYQGSALPAPLRRRLERLQPRATVVPDRVVLLDLSPAEARRRRVGRARARDPLEGDAVQRRVARAYRRLAKRDRWIVVDAARSAAAVVSDVASGIAPRRRRRAIRRTRRRT
jgi:dTMP kinase